MMGMMMLCLSKVRSVCRLFVVGEFWFAETCDSVGGAGVGYLDNVVVCGFNKSEVGSKLCKFYGV